MSTQKQRRHTGMDCRYPDHTDVISACHPWLLDSGNPCRNDVACIRNNIDRQ